LISSDLEKWGVSLFDTGPTYVGPPPVSAIITEVENGARTIVNSPKTDYPQRLGALPEGLLEEVDIALVDGFYTDMACDILKILRDSNIETVLDAGSWREGIEAVLPHVTTAICSERFYVPSGTAPGDVIAYLHDGGIPRVAITRGGKAILYSEEGRRDSLSVAEIEAVDTLGAGDIFHGAYCYYSRNTGSFRDALQKAAEIAGRSCAFFGTREWMTQSTNP
jgi:sugar/nucleoside kinase (ribokinase family)